PSSASTSASAAASTSGSLIGEEATATSQPASRNRDRPSSWMPSQASTFIVIGDGALWAWESGKKAEHGSALRVLSSPGGGASPRAGAARDTPSTSAS